jgi:uncharacterized protein (DUF2384 family)
MLKPSQYDQAVASLVSQVQSIVEQSGDPAGFDAAQWVAHWIETPVLALGGRMPIELLDTAEGRDQVSKVLAMTQSGAYA